MQWEMADFTPDVATLVNWIKQPLCENMMYCIKSKKIITDIFGAFFT